MDEVYYPRLVWRIRALLIDAVLLPFSAIGLLLLGTSLGIENPILKISLFVLPILVLGPVLVSFTGGTVGHHLYRIRVMKRSGQGNINIFAAIIRFILKTLLGWFSLVFIFLTKKHQAIHDLVAGSIVVHKNISKLPDFELLKERASDTDQYEYPAIWKRLLTILIYSILITIASSVLAAFIFSTRCLVTHACTYVEQFSALGLDIGWVLAVGTSIVLGWKGRLYGCRKKIMTGSSVF